MTMLTKNSFIDEINKLLLDSEIQKKQIEDLREFKLIMKKNINNPSENASNIIKNILEN